MFRALTAHLQESLNERRSTTAHNSHQICLRLVTPEDGQVMPETCGDSAP
jgi:hypothetical protein